MADTLHNLTTGQTPGHVAGTPDNKHDAQDAHEHVDALKSYLIVFFTLLALLLLTVGVYTIDLGVMNTVIALIIASIKGLLVMLVFMHLRHGTRLTWVIASTGFVWLCIMITFLFADYLSRNAIPEAVKYPVAANSRVAMHEQSNAEESSSATMAK